MQLAYLVAPIATYITELTGNMPVCGAYLIIGAYNYDIKLSRDRVRDPTGNTR